MTREHQVQARLAEAFQAAGVPSAGENLMVTLDLDGTLLRRDDTISQRTHEAYQAHVDAGTRLVIATGRGRQSAQPIADKLGITDSVMVCSNGNQTVLSGNAHIPGTTPRTVWTHTDHGKKVKHRIINFHPMPQKALHHALHELRAEFPDALFAVEPIEGPRIISHNFPDGYLSPPYTRGNIDLLSSEEALRLILIVPNTPGSQLRQRLSSLHLPGVEWATSSSTDSGWVDIGAQGITKAVAVEQLRQEFNIASTATVAIGDGGNDVDMLSWASVGVAMGQAEPYVHKAATTSTCSVHEDGAAILLETLLEH